MDAILEQSAVSQIAEKCPILWEATVHMDTFPAIYQLLKALATIRITTCQRERCISRLRIIKTYMISTMTEERLNGLALLSIHRDMT